MYYNYDCSTGLPELIQTDFYRFQKIIINILSIAIKQTERGHIRVSATKQEVDKIKFIFEDTGIGMTNAQM